ncbi:MAG: exo-alpha-sialidase [Planctomycetaceae bacterium]|nr:exo-alpha-sialidase [Planctomycetales bacterium]MCB9924674.1 exo-alpha-sialidase [Planctomycetaceae bacterium]
MFRSRISPIFSMLLACSLPVTSLPIRGAIGGDKTAPTSEITFELWNTQLPFPSSQDLLPIEGIEFRVIKPRVPEQDGYDWLHGVALAWHKGRLYSSFGHNSGAENTATEEANGRISDDGGKTWGPLFQIDAGEEPNLAISHGVFLSHQGRLWAFHGAFYGRMQDVHTRAYSLDESTGNWVSKGIIAKDGFWAMQEPQRMANGNWIMAGISVTAGYGGTNDPAAVAICRSDNLTKWDVIKIPKPASMEMWGESCVILDGPNILDVSRYRKPMALVATSENYGETWSTIRESNMPMAGSQPSAGMLSTGQRFLICSTTADGGNQRHPLTIAVGNPNEETFCRVYRIRDAIHVGPGESAHNAALAYPYAIEHEGRLYVGYSNSGGRGGNRNSAELAIIPIEALQAK